jgi:NAD-dependent deacetylase
MKQNLVVLTGAGISAESGIQTFRDANGLWENHKIEDVATPEAWERNPELVLKFYNARRAQAKNVVPNIAHKLLVELEKQYNVYIITQNVDDLHERAGSKNILHLHGSLFSKCSSKTRDINAPIYEDMILGELAPDGSYWRPNIVWFGENVDKIDQAVNIVENADILLIIGTSLQVYPAAGLKDCVRYGVPIYVIDPNLDYQGNRFTTCIKATASAGLKRICEILL